MKFNQILVLSVFFTMLTQAPLRAQETWSLQRCIEHAQQQNLSVKQATANARVAALSERQAKTARLPNVSANINGGEQFGRNVDPSTNQFNNTAFFSNSMQLQANAPLFSGGQIHHSIKQAGYNAQAAKADVEQTINNLGLQVAQAYLNILLNEEQVINARNRVAQSQRQLDNTQKLIDAGSLPPAERFTLVAQIARDEQSVIQAQNTVDLAYLSLKQLLFLEPDFDLRIERPAVVIPAEASPENLTLTPLYNTALSTQPNIRAGEMRLKGAETAIKVARADFWPQLSLSANLNSFYSSQFRDVARPILGEERLSDPISIRLNNQDITYQQYFRPQSYPAVPYADQINLNFGQAIFLNLRIPLYQNGTVSLGVERARLNLVNAQLQNAQTQQQLKNDIQTAIANARAAQKTLDAAQKTLDASQLAFTNTERRFNLGGVNTLELTTAQNNLDIARVSLTVAKYDYLFRLKIIDFYQGKALSIN
jgi:outer membrane protein